MSDKVTLPEKPALTGPIRKRTLAVISVSESFSSVSQPGMQACRIAWSFSAAKTLSRGAAILYSPLISMGDFHLSTPAFRLPLARIGVRRQFCQRLADRYIYGGEIGNRHQYGETREPVGLRIPEQRADHPTPAVTAHEAARAAVVDLDRAFSDHQSGGPEDQQASQCDFRQDRPQMAERTVHAHVACAAVVAQQAAEGETAHQPAWPRYLFLAQNRHDLPRHQHDARQHETPDRK